MCGIAGIHRRNGAKAPELERLAEEMLLALELRGRDATGWLTIEDSGNSRIRKDTLPAHRFVKRMKNEKRWALRNVDKVRTLMAHTRFATVGHQDDPRNAHPHVVGRVAAIHNGTIYNHSAVFALSGRKPRTTVDSECIPALVDAFGWANFKDALELLAGGAALALVHQDHPRELVLARVAQFPMFVGQTKEYIVWASTPEVIHRAWTRVTGKRFPGYIKALQDGEFIHVVGGKITMGNFTPMERPSRPKFVLKPSANKKQKKARRVQRRKDDASRKQRQLSAYAEEAARRLKQHEWSWEEDREAEIEDLMSIGISRKDAEQLVDEGMWTGEVDDMSLATRYETDESVTHGAPRRFRGHVETKSPAQLAEEALGS